MISTLKTYCYVGIFFIVCVCVFFAGAALDSAANLIESRAYVQGQRDLLLSLPVQALTHIDIGVSNVDMDI